MKLYHISTILAQLIFVVSLFLFAHPAMAEQLKPFTTDGCSMFPDGTFENNTKWVDCCVRHDFAYWKGGSFSDRQKADEDLEQCVKALGEKEISQLMFSGVRVGGSPFYPTPYRWGYGWSFLRGYRELSQQEEEQVRAQLLARQNLISDFLKSLDEKSSSP